MHALLNFANSLHKSFEVNKKCSQWILWLQRVEKIEAEREVIKELNRRYRAELQKKVDEEKKKKQRKKKKPAAGTPTPAPAPRPTQPAASAKIQPAARASVARSATSAPTPSGNKSPPVAKRNSATKITSAPRG